MSVAEAKRIIREGKPLHSIAKLVIASHKLLDSYDDPEVTIEDMLRCLGHGGTVATVGARCLYVRTGRDKLGWELDPKEFIYDRANWESYLRLHAILL